MHVHTQFKITLQNITESMLVFLFHSSTVCHYLQFGRKVFTISFPSHHLFRHSIVSESLAFPHFNPRLLFHTGLLSHISNPFPGDCDFDAGVFFLNFTFVLNFQFYLFGTVDRLAVVF